jgi:hypothetical protein
MKRNTDIAQELNAICPVLASLSHMPPQGVPEGYFDGLPAFILSRLKEEAGTLPSEGSQLSEPEGYFDQLPGRLLDRIRQQTASVTHEGADELPRILAGLERSMPHQVPAGYFNNLADRLVTAHTGSSPAPEALVIKMKSRISWAGFAAAASLTGILLLSAWYFLYPVHDQGGKIAGMTNIAASGASLDTLPMSENDMASFLEESQGLENLDPAEPLPSGNADLALLDMDENGVREVLSTVPDHALDEYMKSNPEVTSN